MNLLLQDLRHLGNSVGFDKDVPEIDNITKRDVKSMNKIAYIRQAVEKAIKPKEKAPKRKILCRTKQSDKEKAKAWEQDRNVCRCCKTNLDFYFR